MLNPIYWKSQLENVYTNHLSVTSVTVYLQCVYLDNKYTKEQKQQQQ